MWQFREHFRASRTAGLDDEIMSPALEDFCKREIEAVSRFRPGLHRNTKAGPARLPAIDRDDENILPPRLIRRIDKLSAEENLVLHGNGMEFAGTHAEKSQPGREGLFRDHLKTIRRAPRPKEPLLRREEKLLPRMRPNDVAKERGVAALLQAISPAILLVRPAGGKLFRAGQRVVDNRAVAHGRADHLIAASLQRRKQTRQLRSLQRSLVRHDSV